MSQTIAKSARQLYRYKLFDGFQWVTLLVADKQLVPAKVQSMAAKEVADWDYGGISQRLDVYETSDEDVYGTKIGAVETPGRLYQCRACYSLYPHPPQELPVCRCGNVATIEDLEKE